MDDPQKPRHKPTKSRKQCLAIYEAQKAKEQLLPVVIAEMNGVPREQAAQEMGISPEEHKKLSTRFTVGKQVRKATQEAVSEILKDKIPILKDITEMSLNAVREKLLELSDPFKRDMMLKTIRDVKDLAAIAGEFNEMLRLELGQSTKNVSVSAQMSLDQTITIFKELQMKDRVFEYPFLDEGEEDGQDPEPTTNSSN